jgi:hypothetical protein
MSNHSPIGTTHHGLCPICGNYTVDRLDGYCKYSGCGADMPDEDWYDGYMEDSHAQFINSDAGQAHDDIIDTHYDVNDDDTFME